ncbi:MAG TPA: MBOAT family O-acyltransferase [Vicinamibacterales bacterium]
MFIEPRFVLVTVLCWVTLALTPARLRSHALVGWSIVLYLLYAPQALIFVSAAILLTYLAAAGRRKWIVIILVSGLLAYFKRPAGLAGAMSTSAVDLQGGGVLVPLGFSYMALELIHYAIETSRGRIRQTSFVDFAAFALFFPCRVAGPIKRFNDFTASVAAAECSAVEVYHGCFRILSGLIKKGVLADPLARASAGVTAATTAGQAWEAMFAYSLSLYLDFSAYSDFAIGVSRLMGIRVPENFNWPYFSSNIQDFWNRWHISLSFWVRDYVFTNTGRQLFKTRLKASPGIIAGTSYLATFLVVGAWHGLSLNFLVWGAYHGLFVTAFHFYKLALPDRIASSRFYQSRLVSIAGMGLTFVLVTIGWVFFRLDLLDAGRVLRLMLVN